MKDVYLQEAFKALDMLNEEDFSLDSNKELDDAKTFINSDDDIDTVDIIDPDLSVDNDEEEDVHDPEDYVGKVILDCCTCHSKIYKDKEDIHIDEETGLANTDEECPFCYSVDGYTLIGEVTPYEEESTDIDEDETEIEDGSLKEAYYKPVDEETELEWQSADLDYDCEQPGVYSFASAKQASIALKLANQHGWRDAWRETQKVYLGGEKIGSLKEAKTPYAGKTRIMIIGDHQYPAGSWSDIDNKFYDYTIPKALNKLWNIEDPDYWNDRELPQEEWHCFANMSDSDPEDLSKIDSEYIQSLDDLYKFINHCKSMVDEGYTDYIIIEDDDGNRLLEYGTKKYFNRTESLEESIKIGKLRSLVKRLNETEMSDEDKHDSEILWNIYNKTQQRANAKLTDEEKEILKKYNLERDPGLKTIEKRSSTPGHYYDGALVNDKIGRKVNTWRSKTRESDVNLADRARKMVDRKSGYEASQYRNYDYNNDNHRSYKNPETGRYEYIKDKGLLDVERAHQNTVMTEPVRMMKNAIRDRKYHGKNVADNNAKYDAEREKIQKEYEKKLADIEKNRNWSGEYHQRELDSANKTINKLLKRDKTDEALSDNKSNGKKVKITDIDWDTEGEDVKLPNSITVPMYQIVDSEDELEDTIADYLSDNYGWLVNSCNYEVINESLSDKNEYKEFSRKNKDRNRNFNYKKYGKYFDKNGELIPEFEDEYFSVTKNESLANKRNIKEHFEKVEIETDKEKMNMTSEENGKVTVTTEPKDNDVRISPVSDETQSEINPVSTDGDDYEDIDIDDFSEEEFNELGESYLKRVYENVNSFKVDNVSQKKNKLIIEGIIGFSSGKKKKTSFVFEAKNIDKKNKVKFIGENLQMSRGAKSFTLCGKVSNGKFISESLNYNYRTKDSTGKSNRVYGTVKTKNR